MKSKEQILLLITFWGLNSLGMQQPKLTVAHPHAFPESIKQNYGLKQDNQDNSDNQENCTPDGICYRPSPTSKDIPDIITPKEGMEIYSSTPILRWRPVKKVVEYTIEIDVLGVEKTLYSNGGDWFIRYEGPELQAGEEYTVTVSANNGYKSPKVMFKMVDREKAQEIEAKINQLQQSIGDREEQNLQIARFYHNEGLLVDAIDTLEDLIKHNTQNSEVHCLLIQWYQEIGVKEFADQIDLSCLSRESLLNKSVKMK